MFKKLGKNKLFLALALVVVVVVAVVIYRMTRKENFSSYPKECLKEGKLDEGYNHKLFTCGPRNRRSADCHHGHGRGRLGLIVHEIHPRLKDDLDLKSEDKIVRLNGKYIYGMSETDFRNIGAGNYINQTSFLRDRCDCFRKVIIPRGERGWKLEKIFYKGNTYLVVTKLVRNGVAARAGVRFGDEIIYVNDLLVRSANGPKVSALEAAEDIDKKVALVLNSRHCSEGGGWDGGFGAGKKAAKIMKKICKQRKNRVFDKETGQCSTP